MNIRKMIIMALLFVMATVNATAQNRIDNMMENYSSRGTSRYTSAVERNPKTRKVQKVVNVIELNNHIGINDFINAFRQESKSGNFIERHTENGLILMLTIRGERNNRIYMINCTGAYTPARQKTNYRKAKISAIIKYE